MEVTATFELPVHIWVMCDALDATCPTGYGELRFNVVMPDGRPPVGGPPPVPGVESRSDVGEQVVWVQEYSAFIPESLRPATALHRVVVTDVEGPSYDHMSWFTPEHQLAEYINKWFDDVRTWTEILTGQDLDPNHRVYDAESVGEGLRFIEPPHDGALDVKFTTPRVRPLRAQEWAAILGFVRDGLEPPLEEVLSRDARAAQRRGANRRAIIDAAIALEIALGRHVRSHRDQLPEGLQRRIGERTALGGYIAIVEDSGLQVAVPVDRLRWLNTLRNDAVHRGAAPGDWDVGSAVQVMIDFLGAHGLIRRTGEREPDGGEWVLRS
ncbi:hypothetical protein [Micromonospora sp. CNB394]|uniref:hypothetical protein n=1 Tax=Micromonospora sp. CNB394 TaxID=1169151 RepID=UPI00036BEE2C|nr:hypothetical protein [Micromonospora sp. CNB394]